MFTAIAAGTDHDDAPALAARGDGVGQAKFFDGCGGKLFDTGITPTVVLHGHDIHAVLEHIHELFVAGGEAEPREYFPTRELSLGRDSRQALLVVPGGGGQSGDRGAMVVRRQRGSAIRGASGEVEMEIIGRVGRELRMLEVDPVVDHRQSDARSARRAPGRPQVKVNAQRTAVRGSVLEIPLTIKVGVVGTVGVGVVQSQRLAHDRVTDLDLRQPGQALCLEDGHPRVRGLQDVPSGRQYPGHWKLCQVHQGTQVYSGGGPQGNARAQPDGVGGSRLHGPYPWRTRVRVEPCSFVGGQLVANRMWHAEVHRQAIGVAPLSLGGVGGNQHAEEHADASPTMDLRRILGQALAVGSCSVRGGHSQKWFSTVWVLTRMALAIALEI